MSLYLSKSGGLLERGKRLGVLEQQTGQFVQSVVRERGRMGRHGLEQ